MHAGDKTPAVHLDTRMRDVIYEMSKKGFGITAVVEGEVLRGVISDGDLRRLLQEEDAAVLNLTAGECMKENPITIPQTELASAALQIMEGRKITSLFVTDGENHLEGILHLHDLWGLELF
jgi:arabinose-5-phosphate isomerase